MADKAAGELGEVFVSTAVHIQLLIGYVKLLQGGAILLLGGCTLYRLHVTKYMSFDWSSVS